MGRRIMARSAPSPQFDRDASLQDSGNCSSRAPDTLIDVSLLENKVALITGAGTGIGRAIALAYAQEGARLALVGRRKQVLEAVAKEAGGSPLILSADVSKQGDIDRVLSATVSQLGTLNVLVNNAGILHIGTAEEITEAQWDETFNINVRGLWLLSRSVLPHMRKAGGG
jgi:NAD(P)-dependent dehydrogenase (short-subunit alcohol dehydrogenase family)